MVTTGVCPTLTYRLQKDGLRFKKGTRDGFLGLLLCGIASRRD